MDFHILDTLEFTSLSCKARAKKITTLRAHPELLNDLSAHA